MQKRSLWKSYGSPKLAYEVQDWKLSWSGPLLLREAQLFFGTPTCIVFHSGTLRQHGADFKQFDAHNTFAIACNQHHAIYSELCLKSNHIIQARGGHTDSASPWQVWEPQVNKMHREAYAGPFCLAVSQAILLCKRYLTRLMWSVYVIAISY